MWKSNAVMYVIKFFPLFLTFFTIQSEVDFGIALVCNQKTNICDMLVTMSGVIFFHIS
jgi:hypothetical protein